MARKFNFFNWASGKTYSKARRQSVYVRRLGLLAVILSGLFSGFVFFHGLFFNGFPETAHPHEIGPHGGIVRAFTPEEPDYHAEFVFEDDGRFAVFVWGEGMKSPVTVRAQPVIAELHAEGKKSFASVILRPKVEKISLDAATSELLGRFSPDLVGKDLSLVISRLEIGEQFFSVKVEMPAISEERRKFAMKVEHEVTQIPLGVYTTADIEANGGMLPSEKYQGFQVSHLLSKGEVGNQCPVTELQASTSVVWVVGGKAYHFCCPACILDFVSSAKEMSSKRH